MFTVIMTEKGGSKQKLEFDEEVVTIGRVQGNQIILPRGNVSKKHARLEFKGGEFRLTDLNSTNGTYVNGRRITGTTVIKPSDNVYIGEFIIGLEGGNEPTSAVPVAHPLAAHHPPVKPKPGSSPLPRVPRPKSPRPDAAEPVKPVADEPDELSSLDSGPLPTVGKDKPLKAPRPVLPIKPQHAAAPTVAAQVLVPGPVGDQVEQLIEVVARQVKRVERGAIPAQLDEGTAGKVRIVLCDTIAEMVARGKLASTVETGLLQEKAFRAIVDLGPLGGWLDDPEVKEIRISGPKSIALRVESGWEEATTGFVGAEDLAEKLRCLGAGVPGRDEGGVPGLVRYRIEDGVMALVSLPPVSSSGPSATLFKNLSARLRHGDGLDMMPAGPAREAVEAGIARAARFAVVGGILPHRISILTDMVRLLPASAFVVGVEDVPFMGFQSRRQIGLAAHGLRKGDSRQAGVGAVIPRALDLSADWIVVSGGWWGDLAEIMACACRGGGVMAELPLAGKAPDRELAAGLAAAGMVVGRSEAAGMLAEAFDYLVIVGCDEKGDPVVSKVARTGVMGDEWMAKAVYERRPGKD